MKEHKYFWEQEGFCWNREELTRLFLPENTVMRSSHWPEQTAMETAGVLLGTKKTESRLVSRFDKTPEEDPEQYLSNKYCEFRDVYYRYARIFDFCRVLGISHVYDIGCGWINQSFLLVSHSAMQYTGIDCSFALIDWQEQNRTAAHCTVPFVREAPPPFCNGRIRFQKGWYPDVALQPEADSIAVACYSFTMCREKEEIARTTAALQKDFNRILFNLGWWPEAEAAVYWQSQDWSGYTVIPVGPCGFVYATRITEDIERLKKVYPCDEKERFITGIDDGTFHFCGYNLDSQPYTWYLDWYRKELG